MRVTFVFKLPEIVKKITNSQKIFGFRRSKNIKIISLYAPTSKAYKKVIHHLDYYIS